MTMSRNVPMIYSQALTDILFYPDKFDTPQIPRAQVDFQADKPDPSMEGAIHWQLTLSDTRSGLNNTVGDLQDVYDRVSSSTLNTEHYQYLTLPLLTTNAASPDPGSGTFLSSANCFDVVAMGIGSTANSSLFAETSSSDPTVVAKTYSPGSVINGLYPLVINGTPTWQLAVMREGGPIQVLSDLASTPTILGTMHADTAQAYGIVQMPTPEYKMLIYAGGKLRSLRGTDLYSREPDDVLQSVPNYGYALGVIVRSIGFSGKKPRAFFMFPRSHTLSQHMLTLGAESPGIIVHTDVDGLNPQILTMPFANIYFAGIIRNGVIASDGERIVFHDGQTITDLKRHDDRGYSSALKLRIRGMWLRDPDVFIEVELQTAGGSANTIRWVERYNFETKSWHQVSGATALTTTGPCALASASGALPLSRTNNVLHTYSDGKWRHVYQPFYGTNPYMYRLNGGAGNTQEFEASGTYLSPQFELPGLEGMSKLVSRITFLGDVDAGGDAASVVVSAGNMNATFLPGLVDRAQEADMTQNADQFYLLQVSVTLNRDTSSTRYNLNGFPVIIEGYAYPDALDKSSIYMYDPR